MARSNTLRKEKQPSVAASAAERPEHARARFDELMKARADFLANNPSANEITSAIGLTPITGHSGPRLFY